MTPESKDHADQLCKHIYGATASENYDLPLMELEHYADLLEDVERLMTAAVTNARAQGKSWAAIGNVIGVTRQAAQQRYAPAAARPAAPMGGQGLLPTG